MIDALWVLILLAAVGAGCFYAGWRSAHSYLEAARAVAEIASAAATQSSAFSSSLDKTQAEAASLRVAIERNAQATETKLDNVEAALVTLFQGFERAGMVRSATPRPGPQVGEPSRE